VYLLILLAAALGASAFSLRHDGIFACKASGYGSDRFLSYCQAKKYGDYDHGAFWFVLEPAASQAAANAQVLFLGNSRLQLGFSTEATAGWFSSLSIRYYLLGFSHNENYNFEAPLLRKLNPRAKALVVNLDLFFAPVETPPARTVMEEADARTRYGGKQVWQRVHRAICEPLPTVCGEEYVIFRSRATGAWLVTGGLHEKAPVTYEHHVDRAMLNAYTAAAEVFLSRLSIPRECVLLTLVPNGNTEIGTAKAIAAALGLELVAPELDDLSTFDGLHLDRSSAERWSTAFIQVAGPQIRRCVDPGPSTLSQAH